ncbi:MAG: 5'-methylthioadenosine/S-adenosylhomocysteine nucleosidase [Haliea sp.]|jgi:adenosylhomocysteine nucleosidase|nr:5'-methylthioadenosine/S-adenosylhomocysteine nucleosidase [Haliea sp.]
MRVVGPGNTVVSEAARRPIRCIAILSAMTSELAPVKKSLAIARRPRNGEAYCTGTYKGVTVITAVTNMGLAASQAATEALFAHYGDRIDHLFVVGVAGAYDQRLKIGEVVIPESVVDHRDGIVRYPTNLGTREPSGLIYSSDQLSYSEDYVDLLNSKNVTAVDMESGAITAVCQRHGCPVTIVRAVSDRVDVLAESYDVFHLAHADGSPKYLAALRFVLRRPQRIAYLVAMGIGAKKAIDAATAELRKNIETLLHRASHAETTADVRSA